LKRLRLLAIQKETEERRARMRAQKESVLRLEEDLKEEARAKAKLDEIERYERQKAARDLSRSKMRSRAQARDQARAEDLVETLRRSVRDEERRVRVEQRLRGAAIVVQAAARRRIARRAYLAETSLRLQRQFCAMQAAWRARSQSEDGHESGQSSNGLAAAPPPLPPSAPAPHPVARPDPMRSAPSTPTHPSRARQQRQGGRDADSTPHVAPPRLT
jgi:hypothetical protein